MQIDVANALRVAARGTAPIVAIPIEGHSPFCVRRKLLAGWIKGVEVHRAEAMLVTPEPRMKFHAPENDWDDATEEWRRPEGPENRVVLIDPAYWTLEVKGWSKRATCRAKFVPIPRKVALVELGKWADKERERQQVKRLKGALGLTKAEQRALKLAAYETDGEGMVETAFAKTGGGVERRMGVPVTLAETPRLRYAIVASRFHDGEIDHFSVVEATTGKAAGTGRTAEAALVDAKRNVGRASAERLAQVEREIVGEAVPA